MNRWSIIFDYLIYLLQWNYAIKGILPLLNFNGIHDISDKILKNKSQKAESAKLYYHWK